MKKRYRNLRKAAILISCVEPAHAEALLGQMSPQQANAVRQMLERLGQIDPQEQAEVIEEFFRVGPLVPDKQPSGLELNDQLPSHLTTATADAATGHDAAGYHAAGYHATGDIAPAGESAAPFDCLRDASPQTLAPLLQHEHPQTIALVVSHLAPSRAAEVLSALPESLQLDVARRLVDLEETDPDILREVERGLAARLGQQLRGNHRRVAGLAALDNILRTASPQTRQHILTNLGRHEHSPPAARPMVAPPKPSFAELERMDGRSLFVVARHAEPEVLVLALAGAAAEFSQRLCDLLPPRQAAALSKSLAALGPTPLSDVEEAQEQLAELANQLELRGQIVPQVRGRLSFAA